MFGQVCSGEVRLDHASSGYALLVQVNPCYYMLGHVTSGFAGLGQMRSGW
jgi:hypothetical protein